MFLHQTILINIHFTFLHSPFLICVCIAVGVLLVLSFNAVTESSILIN